MSDLSAIHCTVCKQLCDKSQRILFFKSRSVGPSWWTGTNGPFCSIACLKTRHPDKPNSIPTTARGNDDRTDAPLHKTVEGAEAHPQMSMMLWMATEGGRKCPQCGRYAKSETLGDLSFSTTGAIVSRISMYGHLPGHGCNK